PTIRFQANRRNRLRRTVIAVRIEQGERIGAPPGITIADRLPRQHTVAAQRPRIERPADRLHVALLDGVGAAVLDNNFTVGRLAVEDEPMIGPHGPAYDVVIQQAVKGIALPLRSRDVAAKDELGLAGRLIASLMESSAEIAQRP